VRYDRFLEKYMAIKTLHITNSWHAASGGIATFYQALMQAANRRGHNLRLIVPGKEDNIEDVGSYCRIYSVAAPPALFNPTYRTIYPSQFLFKGSKLQRILAKEQPDLIEISDKYTLAYLGGLLRLQLLKELDFRPVIVGLSNERMDDNFRSYLGWLPLGHRFCSWYMRWIYFAFFDHHIANSSYTAEELRAASHGHLVRRGTWIRHMGADVNGMSPAHASAAGRQRLLALCGAGDGAVLLLYVGRLAPEKNLRLLFSLIEHLNRTDGRPFHLIIAGDGMERAFWERHAALQLPGRVLFLGHVRDRKMLAMLYANADVFVHPNPHEPFGIAPLEAMACGLPLVAPNSGGVSSYASEANAWMVPPTVEKFAAAVHDVIGNRELVAQRTQRALATAAAHSWDRVADGFLDLYQELHSVFHGKALLTPPDFYSVSTPRVRARMASWASWLVQVFWARTPRPARLREPAPPGFRNSVIP
jgi:alpha-1,6-mannosyltransferase